MSILNNTKVGQIVRGVTESGRRFVAVKVHEGTGPGNPSAWNTTEGPMFQSTLATAPTLVLVDDVPNSPAPGWDPLPLATRAPQPRDFFYAVDHHQVFSFFENEEGEYLTYGHADPVEWGKEIRRYWEVIATADDAPVVSAAGLQHLWGIITIPNDDRPEEWYISAVPEGAPNARPYSLYVP